MTVPVVLRLSAPTVRALVRYLRRVVPRTDDERQQLDLIVEVLDAAVDEAEGRS